MWRTDVAPFDDRERELLEEFAVQGAIVLRQVDLMRALESRGAELSDKVEQLEALREVDEAVGSSLDLDEVLERIVTNAVRLTNLGFGDITLSTDGGSILEYDEATDSFHVRGKYGSSPALLGAAAGHHDRPQVEPGRPDRARRPAARDPRPRRGRARRVPRHHVPGRMALGARRADDRRRRDDRRAGDPPPRHRRLPARRDRAARDLRQPVGARHRQRPPVPRAETQSRELEIASNHKSEFLASMSHELRTPLNAVIGFSEVLLERMFGEINERQEEYLRDIWNSGRHLLELLNEILDLSKVEAGQMVLDPSTFSVAARSSTPWRWSASARPTHAITISVDIADDVGEIEADELRFKQVVLNLLSNAVKFTPDGGSVSVARLPGRRPSSWSR